MPYRARITDPTEEGEVKHPEFVTTDEAWSYLAQHRMDAENAADPSGYALGYSDVVTRLQSAAETGFTLGSLTGLIPGSVNPAARGIDYSVEDVDPPLDPDGPLR